MTITFAVRGAPSPKGSKTAVVRGNRAVLLDARRGPARAAFARWERAVQQAAEMAARLNRVREPIAAPVNVAIVFRLRRPVSRKKAAWPDVRPDLDKLVRAVLDPAVAAGLLRDDSRVVGLDGTQKRYADETHHEGCVVTITTL